MAKGFKHGAGGAGLNFKVICNPQPASAKENTIWIDTDRINNYYFSATQPENMAEYDVWFPTGTSSSVAFSATKKNPIMVYPVSAKQYIGGAWVEKTAKSYQNGEWKDWLIYLLENGNEHTDITGGWTASGYKFNGYPFGPVTNDGSKITMVGVGGASYGACGTNNAIDISSFNSIVAKGKTNKSDSDQSIFVAQSKTIANNSAMIARYNLSSTSGDFECQLDISGIPSGKYYIGAIFAGNLTEVVLKA